MSHRPRYVGWRYEPTSACAQETRVGYGSRLRVQLRTCAAQNDTRHWTKYEARPLKRSLTRPFDNIDVTACAKRLTALCRKMEIADWITTGRRFVLNKSVWGGAKNLGRDKLLVRPWLLVSFSDPLVTLEGVQSLFGKKKKIILAVTCESNGICHLLATDAN